jgi:hypothetical protein
VLSDENIDSYVANVTFLTLRNEMEPLMSPVSNSERQRRFRELTLKERQVKADAFEWLIAAIDSKQSDTIPLPDGRQLKVDARDGVARVEIADDPKMQAEIARARFRRLYEE